MFRITATLLILYYKRNPLQQEEVLRERVEKAKEILTLKGNQSRDVQDIDEERMQSFEQCAGNKYSRDTRCLVVLEGFNDKQGKQYFWERQRAKVKKKRR